MRRIVDFLAPLGLVVMVGSQWAFREAKPIPGKPEFYLIAGAALILAHLLLRFEDITRAVGARRLRYGGNTVVLTLVVFGILATVNWLVYRHTKRWDLTKNQRYSLSEQSRKVAAGLKDEVKVSYFQKSAEMAYGQERMKNYEAASPKIKVSFVDPLKDPGTAREYGVTTVPSIVVERGSKREKIANDSEQDVTNALIKVTRDTKKTVCFAEGEGERDPDDSSDRGYSAAKSALGKSQYEIQKVLLLREKKVPEACTVFVVGGPEKDLLPAEIDAVRAFVKGGGKALLMVEPEFKDAYPNLTGLLKEWNIETAKDVVVDASGVGELFGAGPITPLAAQYPYHEITKDFRVTTAFHTARSMEAGKATIEGVTAQNLAETSPASWAESDLTLKQNPLKRDEGKDRKGPIALAVVATIREPEPKASPSPSPSPEASPTPGEDEKPKKPEGRVIAFGDVDFASNALLGFQGNADFFQNAVAWLAQDADLISIRPKEAEDQRMFLTRSQEQNILILALGLLPGSFVALGVAAWWRRR
jgi:ABC-type uncharacterized transport system involved in gliding motility auxiliary subunit